MLAVGNTRIVKKHVPAPHGEGILHHSECETTVIKPSIVIGKIAVMLHVRFYISVFLLYFGQVFFLLLLLSFFVFYSFLFLRVESRFKRDGGPKILSMFGIKFDSFSDLELAVVCRKWRGREFSFRLRNERIFILEDK